MNHFENHHRRTRGARNPSRSFRRTPIAAALAVGLFGLHGAPAAAANINVDGTTCILAKAIDNANTDTDGGGNGCVAGNGADTLVLQSNSTHLLTAEYAPDRRDGNALPLITSTITIAGNGSTLARAPSAPLMRVLYVAQTGSLRLQDTTISGGSTNSTGLHAGSGAGILVVGGSLSLVNSTVSGNKALGIFREEAQSEGGGIAAENANVTLNNSTVSGNTSSGDGGGISTSQGTLNVIDSRITGNQAYISFTVPDPYGGTYFYTTSGSGGGITSFLGTTTITGSVISGNVAKGGGGLRMSIGTVTLSNSTVTGNSANLGAGIYLGNVSGGSPPEELIPTLNIHRSAVSENTGDGIFVGRYSRLLLEDSTVSGNLPRSAGEPGRGIFVFFHATATLRRSTLSGHTGVPMDLFNGTASLINSTVSGNTATGVNGAIHNRGGVLDIDASTITQNQSNGGGAVLHVRSNEGDPSTTVRRSIVAGNTNGDLVDLSPMTSFVSEGDNLVGTGNGTATFTESGDQMGVNPLLGPLQNNGGPTSTHALLANSPAVDALCGSPASPTDQRGVARPQGLASDIGAFELQNPPVNLIDVSVLKEASATSVIVGDPLSFTLSVRNLGTGNLASVNLADTLPAGFSFDSATPSQGTCEFVTGTLSCNLMSLSANGSATVSVLTTTTGVLPLDSAALNTNTASVIGGCAQTDTDPSNNDSSVTVLRKPVPDSSPDDFSFANASNVPPGSTQTSAPATITGINQPVSISVTGGQYSLGCLASGYTSGSGTISNGQTVCLRHTASASFSTSITTTLTVGDKTGSFTSTTRAVDTTPNAFTFIDQTNVPRSSVRTSNVVTVNGFDNTVPISIAGGGYSIGCTGTFTTAAGSISSGQTVCVRHTSAATYNSGVNTILTVGGVSDTFTSVTAPNAVAALLGVIYQIIVGAVGAVLGFLGALLP